MNGAGALFPLSRRYIWVAFSDIRTFYILFEITLNGAVFTVLELLRNFNAHLSVFAIRADA